MAADRLTRKQALAALEGLAIAVDAAREGAVAKLDTAPARTARRKIKRAEALLGVDLLERASGHGVTIAFAAEDLMTRAEQIMAEIQSFGSGEAPAAGPDRERSVRIGATPGIGAIWLAERLLPWQLAHPEVTVSHSTNEGLQAIELGVVDIALRVFSPGPHPRLMQRRLGGLRMRPLAAQSYLDHHGAPGSLAALANHRLITNPAYRALPQLAAWNAAVETAPPDRVYQNSDITYLAFIRAGAGVGLGPLFLKSWSDQIREVEIADCPEMALPIYVVTHESWRRHRAVSAIWEELVRLIAQDTGPDGFFIST